jgi:hypothetical protein
MRTEGQESVAVLDVFVRRFVGPGRGEDQSSVAGDLVELDLGRPEVARLDVGLQDLRAQAAREAAVQEEDEPLGRNAAEPFLEQIERHGRARQILSSCVSDPCPENPMTTVSSASQSASEANSDSIAARVASASVSRHESPPNVSANSASSAVASRRAQLRSPMAGD